MKTAKTNRKTTTPKATKAKTTKRSELEIDVDELREMLSQITPQEKEELLLLAYGIRDNSFLRELIRVAKDWHSAGFAIIALLKTLGALLTELDKGSDEKAVYAAGMVAFERETGRKIKLPKNYLAKYNAIKAKGDKQ